MKNKTDDEMIDALEQLFKLQRWKYQDYVNKIVAGSTSMILGAIYLVGGTILELMWLQLLAIVMALYGIYLTVIRK